MTTKKTALATLFNALSPREAEVFTGLAEGLSLQQIADRLGIDYSTVSTYRWRVVQKTGLPNEARMAHYAIAIGLIKPIAA